MARATSTRCSGCRATRAPTRSSRRTGSWPATYHPDVNKDPAAEERFKEINEAYDVLSDPEQRAPYDRFGADFRQVPEDFDDDRGRCGPGGGRSARRREPDGPGGRRRVRGRRAASATSDGGIDFEDLFGAHVRRRGGAAGPIPGADQEAELAAHRRGGLPGRPRSITLAGPADRARYDVTIPPGVVDGQRIRLAGAGRPAAPGGARPGDLYLRVRIAPHPRYRRRGPRHPRRAARRAVGGGARRDRRRSTTPGGTAR